MIQKNRFISSNGAELDDEKIVEALTQAAEDYENGELVEVRDLLKEIIDAIDLFKG
jgi:hypothetical protein